MSSAATSLTSSSSASFFGWLYTTILHPLFVKTFFRFFQFVKPAIGYFTHPSKGKDSAYDCESSPSESPSPTRSSFSSDDEHEVYYNPRLDPKNFLNGPLSHNPATRLRQMLARPGIVVCTSHLHLVECTVLLNETSRWLPVSATVLVSVVHWRLALRAFTKGKASQEYGRMF